MVRLATWRTRFPARFSTEVDQCVGELHAVVQERTEEIGAKMADMANQVAMLLGELQASREAQM